ncbi:type 1 glutamine amidotransferase domain-containing protein [Allohahella marinimesophila]|uniref:Type 1 glutamine amidotransferase domain-containing protein n=1 Tax=Allohahella marinimesophila TaxID=1054972 RepID=A0ABP7NHC2_9GAMM
MAGMLILLPDSDYDPTESAVPWSALESAGHSVLFATPEGKPAYADKRLVSKGFGLLTPFLMTRKSDLACYGRMIEQPAFLSPLAFSDILPEDFEALLVPGGHAGGVKSLLENADAQRLVVDAFRVRKPVAAVCHGVLLLARSIDSDTDRSVLHGRKTTALTKSLELTAWQMTRLWLGDYYRTYPESVEEEVRRALADPDDFSSGSPLPVRDTETMRWPGFTVLDDHYLSARWPGDCHRFAAEFVNLVSAHIHSSETS